MSARTEIETTPGTLRSTLHKTLVAHLYREWERIRAEIHDYPPPIPACDAQFNHLIQQRAHVTQEIRAVKALGATPDSPDAETDQLRRLIADSQILSREAKTRMLGALA